MTQDMFPIDGRGRTFNVEGVEVKLSPAMQRLVRALNAHGYVDPIRDFGRGTGTNTVVALMDRGILRPASRYRGIHQAATTPTQVWDEAHDEDARRDAERVAHAADPESWVQTVDDSDADEVHIRARRDGSRVRILSTGFRSWRVYFPGQRVSMSASGTWQEARAAADRYERNDAHDDAIAEDRARTETSPEHRAARRADSAAYQRELARELGLKVKGDPEPEGWGQPDGMLSPSTEPVWTPTVGDTVLYRANNPKYGRGRALGRVLLVDGINIKVQWPGGVDWHHATALEHHPMPSDTPVRAKLEAQNAAADTLLQADLRAGRADGKALPIVPNTPVEARAVTAGKIAELLAPADSGVPAAIGVAIMDLLRGNTPAEARTGVSDRAAAALADVAELRARLSGRLDDALTVRRYSDDLLRLDRIEAALRERH